MIKRNKDYDREKVLKETKEREEKLASQKFEENQRRFLSRCFVKRG